MSKPKILYVEDEISLAKIVCDVLQHRGYEVLLEHDGGRAVEQFESFVPDVCLLDVMLPHKDGFAIADEIRSRNHRVPVIFLTAKSDTKDVVHGFRLGGNDYIRKPFSMEELLVRIENALRHRLEAETPATDEVTLGRYRFQLQRQTLADSTGERKLSYRESELLKLLYQHRGQLVQRRELLNLLWGSDSFFNSRTLDVYITKLRNYLRADPALEIITMKGVGYRFVCP